MTPFSSVAMLEKLVLLKIALCNAPALSSASVRLRAVTSSMPGPAVRRGARLELAGIEQHRPAENSARVSWQTGQECLGELLATLLVPDGEDASLHHDRLVDPNGAETI